MKNVQHIFPFSFWPLRFTAPLDFMGLVHSLS